MSMRPSMPNPGFCIKLAYWIPIPQQTSPPMTEIEKLRMELCLERTNFELIASAIAELRLKDWIGNKGAGEPSSAIDMKMTAKTVLETAYYSKTKSSSTCGLRATWIDDGRNIYQPSLEFVLVASNGVTSK